MISRSNCACWLLAGLCATPLRADNDARQQLLLARAELEALRWEQKLTQQPLPDLRRIELRDASPLLDHITRRLETTHQARMTELTTALQQAETERDQALERWRAAAATIESLERERERLQEYRAQTERDAPWFDSTTALLLSGGAFLTLLVLLFVLHDRRTLLRRRARLAQATLFLLVLSAMANQVRAAIPVESLDRRQVASEIERLKQELDQRRHIQMEAWANLLTSSSESPPAHGRKLQGWEEDAAARARALVTASFAIRLATDETEAMLSEATGERDALARAAFQERVTHKGRTIFRASLGILAAAVPLGLYWFLSPSRRALTKVSITATGIAGSGKTLWRETLTRALPIEPNLTGNATTLVLSDKDPWGAQRIVLHLAEQNDSLAAAAINADSCCFFLDVAQVQNGLLEAQRLALQQFLEERRRRQTDRARPLAICLSHLERSADASPFGLVSHSWVERLQSSGGKAISLALLSQRSRWCEEVLPFLFQGWDVVKEVRLLHDGPLLFFPISSEAFGAHEPLLWLTHLQGFCVLEEPHSSEPDAPARAGLPLLARRARS